MGRIIELSVVGLICIKPSRSEVCYTAVFSVVTQRSPPTTSSADLQFCQMLPERSAESAFLPFLLSS